MCHGFDRDGGDFNGNMAMVNNLTNALSLTGEGLRDWLVQRISSVVVAAYFLFLMGFILMHPKLEFWMWQTLFVNPCMRIFTVLFLLSLVLHAWVGVWTVATDYLKVAWFRLIFEVAVILALIGYFIWGVSILWSI